MPLPPFELELFDALVFVVLLIGSLEGKGTEGADCDAPGGGLDKNCGGGGEVGGKLGGEDTKGDTGGLFELVGGDAGGSGTFLGGLETAGGGEFGGGLVTGDGGGGGRFG